MSEGSDDNFDAYREDIRSIGSVVQERSFEKPRDHQFRSKINPDYYSKLNLLNKALRGKLKQLNERLERVLDKVYIKSLNPNKISGGEVNSSYMIQIADKELENAKNQYEHWSYEMQKLDNDIKIFNDPKAVVDLESTIKRLKDSKRELNKEIADLKYVKLSQGKHLKKLVEDPKELGDTDALLYKLKVLKKKEEKLQLEVENKRTVVDSLKARASEWKVKSVNEAKGVENAERKSALQLPDKDNSKQSNKSSLEKDYRNTIDSINISSDSTQENRLLADLKIKTKLKKLELDKLLIELHERDKENRLLNLKVKELERIVPHTKLNPMSRDNSMTHIKKKSKLNNVKINDANKSVLITKKEKKINLARTSNNGKISQLQNNKIDLSKQPVNNDNLNY